MKIPLTCVLLILALGIVFSCGERPQSLDEVKTAFDEFGSATMKWKPARLEGSPITRRIDHHPEEFGYLNSVEIFSKAHLSDGFFITGFVV